MMEYFTTTGCQGLLVKQSVPLILKIKVEFWSKIFEKLPLFLKLSCVDLYNFSNHPSHGTEGRPLAVGMDTGHVRTTVSVLCSFFQICSTWKLF